MSGYYDKAASVPLLVKPDGRRGYPKIPVNKARQPQFLQPDFNHCLVVYGMFHAICQFPLRGGIENNKPVPTVGIISLQIQDPVFFGL